MIRNKINFLEELLKRRDPVWAALQKYLSIKNPRRHYEMIKEYPLRQGKYLRPGLLLLAIEMFGGNPRLGLLPAAAMQASEDWLLIHDDVEDHSELRRHKPTLNMLHGSELAINAGDALHLIMWKIIGDSIRQLKTQQGWKVFENMNQILLTATEGQYLELQWIRDKKVSVTEKEYLDMIKRKTASYTIIGPLQLGAIIAGASKKEIQEIEQWGLYFGYAFQIWDDFMNLNASRAQQGKEFAGDILEGKRTLIVFHLMASATTQEKREIEKIYRKNRLQKTEKDKKYILKLIHKYGSDTYAKEKSRNYAKKAQAIFLKSTAHLKNKKAKEIIEAGIEFVSNREN